MHVMEEVHRGSMDQSGRCKQDILSMTLNGSLYSLALDFFSGLSCCGCVKTPNSRIFFTFLKFSKQKNAKRSHNVRIFQLFLSIHSQLIEHYVFFSDDLLFLYLLKTFPVKKITKYPFQRSERVKERRLGGRSLCESRGSALLCDALQCDHSRKAR